jgi:hypothetical protein
MQIEFSLVALEGRRGRRIGEDVALDEVIAGRALVQAFLEVVCCALALKLKGLGLESTASSGC